MSPHHKFKKENPMTSFFFPSWRTAPDSHKQSNRVTNAKSHIHAHASTTTHSLRPHPHYYHPHHSKHMHPHPYTHSAHIQPMWQNMKKVVALVSVRQKSLTMRRGEKKKNIEFTAILWSRVVTVSEKKKVRVKPVQRVVLLYDTLYFVINRWRRYTVYCSPREGMGGAVAGEYVSLVFIDYSSLFNIIPTILKRC